MATLFILGDLHSWAYWLQTSSPSLMDEGFFKDREVDTSPNMYLKKNWITNNMLAGELKNWSLDAGASKLAETKL